MCIVTGDSSSRALLFDLDGTLIDSFPGIVSAYHHVLVELGLGVMNDAELRGLIGPPIQAVLEDRFGLRGDRLQEGIRIFRHHYGSEGLFRFSKFAGIDDMLTGLSDQGFDLHIATSKLRSMAIDIVDHAGWSDLFTIVGGASPDGSRHLKKDVIEWTLGQIPEGSQAVAMVGDRGVDILGGRALGLHGIGVTWGYGSAEELVEAGASKITDSPAELRAVVACLA